MVTNPVEIGGRFGDLLNLMNVGGAVLLALSLFLSVISIVVRLRRARGERRQQIKWIVYVGAIMVAAFLAGSIVPGDSGPVADLLWVVGFITLVGIPVAAGVAILRYRLYGIDVVINRTLVYGTLTAILALVYFGCVVVLRGLIFGFTGRSSQLAVVASTLAVAALLNPLRRRIQGFIDRRFYRRKYDARKTLEAFAARLRDETDLDALNNELGGVVRETICLY